MDEGFIYGIINGRMFFEKYLDVPYVNVDGLEYPEVVLLGSNQGENNTYLERRVSIKKSSIFLPDKKYGILGSHDYFFPDSNQDLSYFKIDLEKLLDGINLKENYNILEERGEDSFLYSISIHDIESENIFFLRLTKHEKNINSFIDYMKTPYSQIGLCLQEGNSGILKSKEYIAHFAENFSIIYNSYLIKKDNKKEFLELINQNKNLKAIASNLGKALSEPRYMESLCREIERKVEPLFTNQ